MLVKATITTVLAALLAGGVVYYSLPETTQSSGSVAVQANQNQKLAQAESQSSDTSKKWIEKYLKSSTTPDQSSEPNAPDPVGAARDPIQMEQASDAAQKRADQVAAEAEAAAQSALQVETPIVNVPAGDVEGVRFFKLDNGVLTEVEELPTETITEYIEVDNGQNMAASGLIRPSSGGKLNVALEQAGKIAQPDLKDRAYMDVVDFAVRENLFSDAERTLLNIQQKELRDTARSRIANAYAMTGRSKQAFDLIEKVEVDELRDVMRVQAIEALIMPERLPGVYASSPPEGP